MTVQTKNLLHLAEMLRNHQRYIDHFDMYVWGKIEQGGCSSSACALGLACLSGEFNINWEWSEYDDDDDALYPNINDACATFGITFEQFDYLFLPSSYKEEFGEGESIPPETVAQRIEKFVENSNAEEPDQ